MVTVRQALPPTTYSPTARPSCGGTCRTHRTTKLEAPNGLGENQKHLVQYKAVGTSVNIFTLKLVYVRASV